MDLNAAIDRYADLLVRVGVNIQPGQTLVLAATVESADFAHRVMKAAYGAGAGEVVIRWIDETAARITYDMAADRVFDQFPDWQRQFFDHYGENGAAFLSVVSSDPEIFKGVDPGRMARFMKARSIALTAHRNRQMANHNAWCVASVPCPAWASKVFPGLGADQAMASLWEAILRSVRIDTPDPVAAWKEHQAALTRRVDILNAHQFVSLRYRNAQGTDLEVRMPDRHVWVGGGDRCTGGWDFMANMPTEEIFSLPHAAGVNGKLVATLPLVYQGNLIRDFWFIFKDGVVVDYNAGEGLETLRELLETDPGAKRLGEVALVPCDSPLSNMGMLFYETLFDENASCHFALGKAYPTCLEGGTDLDGAALEARGCNESLVHVDFMVGSPDLEIIGTKADGTQVPVFVKGNFAF